MFDTALDTRALPRYFDDDHRYLTLFTLKPLHIHHQEALSNSLVVFPSVKMLRA